MCAARVLVVEDDPDIAVLIQLHLESAPYQVRIAADGTQGLQLARVFARAPPSVAH